MNDMMIRKILIGRSALNILAAILYLTNTISLLWFALILVSIELLCVPVWLARKEKNERV